MGRLRTAVAAHAGGLPSQFWWIWIGAFVSALATFVFLFLAVYLTARGFDPQRIGLIVSCFGLGAARRARTPSPASARPDAG